MYSLIQQPAISASNAIFGECRIDGIAQGMSNVHMQRPCVNNRAVVNGTMHHGNNSIGGTERE